MNCSYCETELKDYIQSAKIPNTENCYYISCKECGSVMKAGIVDGVINVIQNTPTTPGPQTEKEITLAKKLFAESGFHVQRYSVDKPKSPENSHKDETTETEVHYENVPEIMSEQDEKLVKKKKSFLAKIRDFCKKLF